MSVSPHLTPQTQAGLKERRVSAASGDKLMKRIDRKGGMSNCPLYKELSYVPQGTYDTDFFTGTEF